MRAEKKCLYRLVVIFLGMLLAVPALAQEEEEEEEGQEEVDLYEGQPEPPKPAPKKKRGKKKSPVVRARPKDMGMYFTFGGLSSMSHSGAIQDVAIVGASFIQHVGLKLVLSEKVMIPIYFGVTIDVNIPDTGSNSTNWGLTLGGGVEYHFVNWRRISPFVAGTIGFGFADPSGESNLNFGFHIGPSLGVEYYIGDRISLTAKYLFNIKIDWQDDPSNSNTALAFVTEAGGALVITYYWP